MTVSVLDPQTALIVIDLQKGLAGYPTAHPISDVVKNVAALADAFRARSLPVVLVNAIGSAPGRAEQRRARGELAPDFADLLPELNQQPGDHLVSKRTWSAFTGTGLEPWLKARDVTQVVVVGVSTSAGVESTARLAHECGFNVTLAVDAMTDLSLASHAHSIAHVFPRLGETGTAQEVIALLGPVLA